MRFYLLILEIFVLAGLGNPVVLRAEEEAPLDPGPKAIFSLIEDLPLIDLWRLDELPLSSDLAATMALQTPVKSQGSRGTCSIFSATGMVESIYKILDRSEVDLAENYLEFLVMARMKGVASEGSDTPTNIPAIQRYGDIFETDWPYETQDWTSDKLSDEERGRAEETCGSLMGNKRQVCLLSHMNPDEDKFVEKAISFRQEYQTHRLWYRILGTQKELKEILRQNYPLILSLEFFYGAWNHKKMETYGIGTRDMTKWEQGVVSTPIASDIRISRQHPAGHSIVVVGYDDQKRLYYFKNSWGTNSFGLNSNLLESGDTAGYGTITYEYANRYGTFYDVYLTDENGNIRRTRQ